MRKMLACNLLVASALAGAAQPAAAQDPVKLSPKMYTVLLENEHVRVLDFRAKAGEKEAMHSHPAALVYMLSSGKVEIPHPRRQVRGARDEGGNGGLERGSDSRLREPRAGRCAHPADRDEGSGSSLKGPGLTRSVSFGQPGSLH